MLLIDIDWEILTLVSCTELNQENHIVLISQLPNVFSSLLCCSFLVVVMSGGHKFVEVLTGVATITTAVLEA